MIKYLKNNIFMLKYLIRARKSYIFLEIGKSILNSLMEILSIYMFKILIDCLTVRESLIYIIPIIIIYTALKKLHELVFEYLVQVELPKTNYALEEAITKDIIEKALTIDLACYDNTEFYNNYTKALSETGGRSIAALNLISTFIFNIISTIGLVSLILTLNSVTILLAVIFFVSSLLFVNKNKKIMYDLDMEMVPYNRHIGYCKSVFFSREAAKDLRIYKGIANYLRESYGNSLHKAQKLFNNGAKKIYFYTFIKSIILAFSEYILPLTFFAYLYLQNYITIGSVTALWESMKNIANNASGFGYVFANLKQSSLYIDNLKFILDYKPQVDTPSNAHHFPDRIEKISFVNVSFKYPDNDSYVLKNINISILANQKIALVGHNGAGKSTLVKLMLRLYDPTEGYIAINGIDIKLFDINEYRKMFVTMFQDFSLFAVPININVLATENSSCNDRIVIESLQKVGLYDRINQEPQGIHSQYTRTFDANGILLSGGEMQKLALARVFANSENTYVNILDEPSASLDVESEELFYNNLIRDFNEKILLLISHRLSTTTNVDKIYMLEKGAVIEEGTHQELMQLNKRYAYIYRLQADKYKCDSVAKEIIKQNYV